METRFKFVNIVSRDQGTHIKRQDTAKKYHKTNNGSEASKEEVVYDLLGISVSEYAEINVYFDDEIIHLGKSGNYLCGHCTVIASKQH